VQQVPKNTLVRFRCMIQDTGLGQEMFISAYEKLDPNGNSKLHCYRYTDDPIDIQASIKLYTLHHLKLTTYY
jgi:hypothetical protein